jgi:hypothetical protein
MCARVDEFQRSWLLAQLGPDADPADLERQFFRLRSVRVVALEVLVLDSAFGGYICW